MKPDDTYSPAVNVPIPAALAYVVLRTGAGVGTGAEPGTGAGLDSRVLKLLHDTLDGTRTTSWGGQFRDMALSSMLEAIVPFKRHPLDIFCASHLEPLTTARQFHGEGMRVPAGYFTFTYTRVNYVDHVRPHWEDRPQLMDPELVTTLMGVFEDSANDWPQLRVPTADEDPNCFLEMTGGLVPRLKSISGASSYAPVPVRVEAHLRLLKASGRVAKEIGGFDMAWCWKEDSISLRYSEGLRPEWVMEMQAASLQGAWAQVECEFFKYLGPLPDLMQPGSQAQGWLFPEGAITNHFGGRSRDIPVPNWCARELMHALPWAWVSHPLYAYTAAFKEENLKEPV